MLHLILIVIALVAPIDHVRARAHRLPDIADELVDPVVDAAFKHATRRVPAALIVALVWGESRGRNDAQPRCGVMQVWPADLDLPPSNCAAWRHDIDAGVAAGVLEIETMLRDPRVAGDLRRALLYRACGNVAFDGSCKAEKIAWVDKAIARWHWLDAEAPTS